MGAAQKQIRTIVPEIISGCLLSVLVKGSKTWNVCLCVCVCVCMRVLVRFAFFPLKSGLILLLSDGV